MYTRPVEGKTPTPQDLKRSFFRDPAKDISAAAAAAAESWTVVAGHIPADAHMSAAED